MYSRLVLAGIAVLAGLTFASAAPISDTAEWAQRFTQSVLKSEPADILARLREVAAPSLELEPIKNGIEKIIPLISSQPGQFAEQFDQRDLGSLLRRLNFAVRYKTGALYYSVVFARDDQGWQLVQFGANTDPNVILGLKWPN